MGLLCLVSNGGEAFSQNCFKISYDKEIVVNNRVIRAVKEADLIIFSSGICVLLVKFKTYERA